MSTYEPLLSDLTPAFLTGQTDTHVLPVNVENPQAPRIHAQCLGAFMSMQQAAADDGIDLKIASGFRDYARQQAIWQRKCEATKTLAGEALDDALHAILRWSAMPGASRHHWGTDMDVYDPSALGDATLQLEPWEYAANGPMHPLYLWLQQHAQSFGFDWPYARDLGGVAVEPWHLSYRPLAQSFLAQMNRDVLLGAWQASPPARHDWLSTHVDSLLERYVQRVT